MSKASPVSRHTRISRMFKNQAATAKTLGSHFLGLAEEATAALLRRDEDAQRINEDCEKAALHIARRPEFDPNDLESQRGLVRAVGKIHWDNVVKVALGRTKNIRGEAMSWLFNSSTRFSESLDISERIASHRKLNIHSEKTRNAVRGMLGEEKGSDIFKVVRVIEALKRGGIKGEKDYPFKDELYSAQEIASHRPASESLTFVDDWSNNPCN